MMHASLLRETDERIEPTFEAVVLTHPRAYQEPPSRYGESRRPSIRCLAVILAAHLAALWGLVAFDVIEVKPKAAETVVTLVPLEIAPPAQTEPTRPAQKPSEAPIVAPPPIVEVAQPPVPQVAVAPTVAPVAPPAPPTPSPAPSAAPAPIVPPTPLAGKGVNAPPKYPIEARRKRLEGTVRLRVLVGVDGLVRDISVARSSGHEVLDEEALRAVRRWKFQVATRDGQPVEAMGFVPIPFVLKD